MEKEGEGPGDDGSREEAPPLSEAGTILRYEEHITGLMVTVARLHGRLEGLRHPRDQGRGSREEEEDDDNEVSDFCSEYTASLPRGGLLPFPGPILALPPPPPPPSLGASTRDLFFAVDEAVSSLEKTVLSHKGRIPSAEAELEGYIQAAEGLEETLRKSRDGDRELQSQGPRADGSGPLGFLPEGAKVYKREIAACKERNAALWLELDGRKEELRQAESALGAYREERDKLQRKAEELRRALSEVETLADGAAHPIWGRDVGASHTPVPHGETPPPAGTPGQTPGTRQEQLRSSIETLQGLNRQLSGALRESKGEAEGLSMVLARLESDHSALCLAECYSERCLEAYEALWGLIQAERGLSLPDARKEGEGPHPGASGRPCQEKASATMVERARRALDGYHSDEEEEALGGGGVRSGESGPGATQDEKEALRGYIRHLRTQQAALKLPAPCSPPGPAAVTARIHAAIGAKVTAVQRATQDTFPATEGPSRMEKGWRLQELQATREALADLTARLHLAAKEHRALGLPLYTYRAQEAAFLLMVRILQRERDEFLRGQGPASSSSSSSSSSSRNSSSEEYGPFCGAKMSILGPAGDAEGTGHSPEPEAQALELSHVLARNQELKERIRSLLADLEERSHESKAQEIQQVELTWDFFKAHRALVLAFLNAQKKQNSQQCRLEAQAGHMGQRQARQLEKLRQALRELEGRREGRGGGPPNGQPS